MKVALVQWGPEDATALAAMKSALARVVAIRDRNHDDTADADREYRSAADQAEAALKLAKSAGI